MDAVFKIARQFVDNAAITQITALGNGLINDTFQVDSPSLQFVLQRINPRVFPKPQWILENMALAHQHIQQKPVDSVKLRWPKLLPASGRHYVVDKAGHFWRALEYITNTQSIEHITKAQEAQQAGFSLAHFHRLLSDLQPQTLHDTLPGFHITPAYLSRYQHLAIADPTLLTSTESQYCLTAIKTFAAVAEVLESAKHQGLLSLRVIHGDPKLNNFLFDQTSQQIVSLIDLDTLKPGLVHYDIGDCLRSCCLRLNPVSFDVSLAEIILRAYLTEAASFFTEQDYQYLYPAIELIAFELGLRFFTDYLEGNVYFKVTTPEQNLTRALGQFQLCASIRQQQAEIKAVITGIKHELNKS
ncbi:MAG: aminoglycoside phosphotransferase family protein [Methylococcaceae bacterium]|jgi:Ser/Thr protein kinase RdoA (MazF antagonist)